MEDGGFLRLIFSAIRSIPRVKAYIQNEKDKLRESIRSSRKAHAEGAEEEGASPLPKPLGPIVSIPRVGMAIEEVINVLKLKSDGDIKVQEGQSKL